jgi:hypothetical protein
VQSRHRRLVSRSLRAEFHDNTPDSLESAQSPTVRGRHWEGDRRHEDGDRTSRESTHMKHMISRFPRLAGVVAVVAIAVEALGAGRKW